MYCLFEDMERVSIDDGDCPCCGFNENDFIESGNEQQRLIYLLRCFESIKSEFSSGIVLRAISLLSHTDSLNGSEWCELADILKQKSSIEDYEKLVAFCLNKAVVENDLTATMKLGFFYKEECKTRRAFNAFKMAAINFNHDKAWFELGNLYEEKSRYRKDDVAMLLLQDALDCYFIAVNQGYADAAWKIYSLFYDSILENKILAKYWFDIAVEMGAVLAWVALADNYQACSFADEANSEKAFSWYQKAALKGDIESIKKISYFYEWGIGCTINATLSRYWLEQYLNLASIDELYDVACSYSNTKAKYKQAFIYMQKVAERGLADAQYDLADMYKNGQGVKQDEKQEFYWYMQAAKQGHCFAQYNLAWMYDHAKGVEQDDKQAVYWYTKAAEQGDADAQNNLGVMYKNGLGIEKNYKKAMYWHTKAAEQGDADAQNSLGFMYDNGQGVEQDYQQAIYWYTQAALQGLEIAKNNLDNLLSKMK